MPCEIKKHTADLRLKVWGNTLPELFSEALKGMMNIIKHKKLERKQKKIERPITVYARDKTALLVDFLNEALSLAQIHKEIYTSVTFSTFSEIAVEAVLWGRKVEEFDEDIKAVTYHEAEVRQNKKKEWETTLVFDI
jgi:SHS2 domain-containing protein